MTVTSERSAALVKEGIVRKSFAGLNSTDLEQLGFNMGARGLIIGEVQRAKELERQAMVQDDSKG